MIIDALSQASTISAENVVYDEISWNIVKSSKVKVSWPTQETLTIYESGIFYSIIFCRLDIMWKEFFLLKDKIFLRIQ